ncbi:hypothetical protein A0H81_07552 [Grifola frondosa]|uniref:Uncharacterized protein n=1 Tax=Grifola frondosa TaxID=5627 RepID=A0A1C7M5D6_GRIFR|nr:hypothetical protein A0H81_07552 [Grifola frondosa]
MHPASSVTSNLNRIISGSYVVCGCINIGFLWTRKHADFGLPGHGYMERETCITRNCTFLLCRTDGAAHIFNDVVCTSHLQTIKALAVPSLAYARWSWGVRIAQLRAITASGVFYLPFLDPQVFKAI